MQSGVDFVLNAIKKVLHLQTKGQADALDQSYSLLHA
jgi:hypothetical protein